jgi:uroporphyrinogen decarboxylase
MRPRDRILTSINHQEPDRVPIDIGGTDVTGINVRAYRNLLPNLGIDPPDKISILDMVQQLASLDETVLRRLEAHCRGIFPDTSSEWQFNLQGSENYDWFIDEWGIEWHKPKEQGYYFDLANHPMADANLKQIAHYRWPDPQNPNRYKGMFATAKQLHDEGEYAVILSGIIGGGPMEVSAWLAGFENFFIALINDPNWADALLDCVLEIKLKFWQTVLPIVGKYIDIISESEDLGTQDRLMISPRSFRQHIKPRLRQLFSGIKAVAPNVKILLHSDGAIMPILPDLIEVGVDILNPVQVSARGMGDTASLKREFGRDLVFWGAVDTQYVLPFGSRQEVYSEVHRRIDDLAPDGGYILAPVHNIQGDVSPENILAMVSAWRQFGNRN